VSPHQVSVRADDAGGDVEWAEELPRGAWQERRRVVLFVHGFNNTYDAALASYEQAIARLAGELPPAAEFSNSVCRFFWPGDANLGPISFISYPTEIEDAVQSAAELETFLRRVYEEDPVDAPLTIVAHSLGCRVVLELVHRLRGADWFQAALSGVCLMAAAVDVDTVAVGGPLYDAATFCAARGLTVLTSDADSVLHYVFPLGSTLAEPGSGRALGRFGPPPGLPASAWPIDTLRHGDYWPMEEPLLRRVVAEVIASRPSGAPLPPRSFLRRDTEPPRELASRDLPEWELSAP
jgi:esterase/lipase superfamily enzyme